MASGKGRIDMKWFKRKAKSIVSKTVLATLAISLTALILVSVFMFIWFRKEMIKDYRQLTKTTMENVDSAFSRIIDDAKNVTAEWFSTAGGTVMRLDPDADFLDYMSFVNNVKSVMLGSSYMQSFGIINKNKEVSLYLATGSSKPDGLEPVLAKQVIDNGSKNKPFVWSIKKQYTESETVSLLTIPISESVFDSEYYSGTTVLNIDLEELKKSLLSEKSNGDFKLMILNSDGIVVCHTDDSEIGKNYSDKEWVKKVFASNTSFEMKDEGQRWDFLSQSCGIDGYFIVAQSDYIARNLNINYIIYILVLVVIVAATLMIVMQLLVSRRIFEPLTQMVGSLKNTHQVGELETEENEGTDEIAFLKQFYQGLSNNMEALSLKKKQDFIVKNMLLGSHQEEISAMLLQSGVIYYNTPYVLAVVYVEGTDKQSNYSMQEYDMLRNMVSGIYTSVLSEYGKCTCLEMGLCRLLLVISRNVALIQNDNSLFDFMEKAEASVKKLASVRSFCVRTQLLRDDGSHCVENVKVLEGALRTRLILGCTETVILPSDCPDDSTIDSQNILGMVKEHDKQGYINTFEEWLHTCEYMQYEEFVEKLKQLAAQTLRASKTDLIELEKMADKIIDRDGLDAWIEQLYSRAADRTSRIGSRSSTAMMELSIDYIRNHYDDPNLSVNLLADQLNISTAYFGKLFTDFTGTKTLDYILKVRMEQARVLLLSEPSHSIAQISTEVGYSNSTYFTTTFKKYYGFTPSRFRDLMLSAETSQEEEKVSDGISR